MIINKYTQPVESKYIPTPIEQIWNSNRNMANQDASSQKFAETMASAGLQQSMQRSAKNAEEGLQRYDVANENMIGANLLLSSVQAIEKDQPELKNMRDNYLKIMSDSIDKYGDNPYVLNSTVASIVNDIKSSEKLRNMAKNYKTAEDLTEFHRKAMLNGEHEQWSYNAAMKAAANAEPFPTLKGVEDRLSRLANNFTPEDSEINYDRVYTGVERFMENDPQLSMLKTAMTPDQWEAYKVNHASAIALREAGNHPRSSRGSGSGSSAVGTAETPGYNRMLDVKTDYNDTHPIKFVPDSKTRLEMKKQTLATIQDKTLYNMKTGKFENPTDALNNATTDDQINYEGKITGGQLVIKKGMGEYYRDNYSAGHVLNINGTQYLVPLDDSELNTASGLEGVDKTELLDFEKNKDINQMIYEPRRTQLVDKNGQVSRDKLLVQRTGNGYQIKVMNSNRGIGANTTFKAPTVQKAYDLYLINNPQ